MHIRSLIALLIVMASVSFTGAQVDSKISEDLRDVHGTAEVLIVMPQYTPGDDLHGMTKQARGAHVFDALRTHAEGSQRPIRVLLDEMGAVYRPFFIVNMIQAWLTSDQMREIAGLAEVERIAPNDPFYMDEPQVSQQVGLRSGTIEWGIQKIGADTVWSALHVYGTGVVVGGADTGIDPGHPAIATRYRGGTGPDANHNYNWHDAIHEISPLHNDSIIAPSNNPCGLNTTSPCDDDGHGTHTVGTMLGADSLHLIGVAPEARWIGCRNMERGYGSPASYIECFEWFLAPTDTNGMNPDPAMAPHVINNSWSCPPLEGCNPENFDLMRQAIINLKAAGIVVVVSAGNSGRECETVWTPPAMFAESFAVGATNNRDTIANFSSRGPVVVDSSFRIKPDVVAPGVGIQSAWLNNGYRYLNGTSMAGPHVAGTVALMISANPELAGKVELIEDILRSTAIPLDTEQACNGVGDNQIPNNTYGYGRIDAFAAVTQAMNITSVDRPEHKTLHFQVSPNPAANSFVVRWDDRSTNYAMVITSMLGRQVSRYSSISNGQPVDISHLANGIYAVTLIDRLSGEVVGAEKLVVGAY